MHIITNLNCNLKLNPKIFLKHISLFNSKSIDYIRWNLINPFPVKIQGNSAIKKLIILDDNNDDSLVKQVPVLIESIGLSIISSSKFHKLYVGNDNHDVCCSKIREQVRGFNTKTLVEFSNDNKWKW